MGDARNDEPDSIDAGEVEHIQGEAPGDADSWACPLPHAHDRFIEAHYFLHRIEQEYHDPALFRFHLNAFIAAVRAVHELLQTELARAGHSHWWKERRQEFKDDPVLSQFAHGRNISLHQRAIYKGSRVSVGLFRAREFKLAAMVDVQSDESSASLLERIVPLQIGHLIDEEHSALGEQIGVERLYFVRDLSEEEDVLRACLRALARTSQALAEAHNRLGAQYEPATDEDVLGEGRLAEITVLLESDLDPTAPYRWGWLEPSEEDGHERD